MFKKMKIYTDGSSLGNPGRGGWGVVFLVNGKEIKIGEGYKNVTNNQMELMAIKKALEILDIKKVKNYEIEFFIDSKYVIDGLNKWIYGWIKNNWRKADKKPVLNANLWKEIYDLKQKIERGNQIFLNHVKAHNGDYYNEMVDNIARNFAQKKELKTFKN